MNKRTVTLGGIRMGAFKGKNAKILTMLVSISVIIVFAYVGFSNKNEQKANEEAQRRILQN